MYDGYEVYDEAGNLVEDPDLSIGRLKTDIRTVHHDAVEGVEEVWHWETIAEYPNGGKDVEKVVDVPGVEAKDAWDEKIPIYIYIPYTQEELDEMEAERNKPTQLDMIEAQVFYTAMCTDTLLEV